MKVFIFELANALRVIDLQHICNLVSIGCCFHGALLELYPCCFDYMIYKKGCVSFQYLHFVRAFGELTTFKRKGYVGL